MAGMAIREEEVTYRAGETTLRGLLALPEGDGPRPAVIVVHEFWGLNDYPKSRARQMAELGYVGFAIDMYGDGQNVDDPGAATELMMSVLGNIKDGEARFQAALDFVNARDEVETGAVAAMGYCFGGAIVLHEAKVGADLRAVASFHGSLGSMHAPSPGQVKAKVLVCHGAADSLIPEEDIANFKKELDAAGADYDFRSYEGALHGFSNPGADEKAAKFGMPLGYDRATDEASCAAARELFAQVFGR